MNCVIYVRVSTDEQAKEGFSIAAQKERLKAFALSQGWTVKTEYIEEGWSAKNIDRPQLQQLLKDIKKEHIDIVLVYRLDRLTRSVLDLYQLLKTFDENNVAFRSATEVYDTSTAMGRLFITLVAALAQWERENLGERVRFGIDQMLDEGKRAGAGSNYGYKFDKDFNCEIVEHEAEAIRYMFNWYLEGHGYTSIAEKLNEMGYKPRRSKKWNRATIKQYLVNPVYIGHYKWSDRYIENSHPPIVDELTFQKVQALRKKRTPADMRHGTFVLTGLLLCGHCNRGMAGNNDRRQKENERYRCSLCHRTVREGIILNALLDEVEKLITSKEYFISRMDQPDNNTLEFENIKIELEKISKQKNKLLDLYTDDDSPFDKNELYEKIKKLNTEEQKLKLKISDLDIDNETPIEKYEKIKHITNVKEHFFNAELPLQKELLNSIFDKIFLYKEKAKGQRNTPITIDYTLK